MQEKGLKKKGIRKVGQFVFSLFFTLLIFSSCKTDVDKKTEKKIRQNQNEIRSNLHGTTSVILDLPKRIEINKEVIGRVLYRSEFDTIALGYNDRRYINLYVAKSKKVATTYSELKKSVLDTLVRVNDSVIFVHDIFFEEEGDYLLDGYIIDEILLDRNVDDDAIMTTIETKIVHPILVESEADTISK